VSHIATIENTQIERVPADELRIGIIGGGVGGRAALQFLRRAGLSAVSLYEQAPAMADVGAGIQVSPNMVILLRRLGLDKELDDVGVRLETGWEMRRWEDGRLLSSQELGDACERTYGAPYYVAHRADLLKLLGADQSDPMVHLGIRCVGVDQNNDAVRLKFADGSIADVDVAIGADGVHSVVQLASATPAQPRFSHLAAYRCLVPADRAPELTRRPVSTAWLGPGRHLVHYPVSRGREINVVAIVPAARWQTESWSTQGRVADLVKEFAGWDDRVTALISAAPGTGLYALFDREPLEHWVNGRIGLLGDAAHPMLPAMAQGAAQAVEDAAVLADCLRTATRQTVCAALLKYEELRRGRATRIQQLSRRRPEDYHLPDGERQRRRDKDLGYSDQLRHSWIWGCGPASSP
jgi:salicylate hydroxylase